MSGMQIGIVMKKKVMITGASRGIGRAIAKLFAKEGYDLYLICQNSIQQLEELGQQLEKKYSIHCVCFAGDISSFAFVQELFQDIYEQTDHYGIDILINNAGISHIGLLTDLSVTEWDSILNTNLSASFYTSKLALPPMIARQHGNIINISSVWGDRGASCEVAYSASKGGLNAFTKALAKELAPSNIQVNAIACGLIDTDMNHSLSPEDLKQLCSEIPADRMGTPEEVAELVLHLVLSPSYLTGQIITIDGGWL